MSVPEQRRIAGYLDDPDIRQYATRQTGPSGTDYRYDEVVTYLQRTGQQGADLLSRAGSGLADRLIGLRDRAAFQRQLVRVASESDEISRADLGEFLRAYERAGGTESRRMRQLVDDTGGDGIDSVARLSRSSDGGVGDLLSVGPTRRGYGGRSGEWATEYRRTLARAERLSDRPGIDSGTAQRVADDVEALPAGAQRRAAETIAETGEDGVRFVDEADDATLRDFFGACGRNAGSAGMVAGGMPVGSGTARASTALQSDGCVPDGVQENLVTATGQRAVIDGDSYAVTPSHAYRAGRHYDALSPENQRLFREILRHDDPDVQASWVRAVGRQNIDTDAVESILRRVDEVLARGHEIKRFRTASEVNDVFPDDYNDPYQPGSLVAEFEIQEAGTFARVHGPDNQARSWMVGDTDIIEGLSPIEIKNRLSLRDEPEYVSDVNVPEETEIRVGEVAANFDGRSGATQFELLERIDSSNFINQRGLPI